MMEGEAEHLFDQFIDLSRTAFGDGYYEAAYHALTGALDVAETASLEHKALTVAQIAQEQADWVNQHAPESRMSARSASERSGGDFYTMLIRQAQVQRDVIRQNKQRAERWSPVWQQDDTQDD
jgi:hypothetical protein